jgi:hypothetical protein
MPRLTIIYGLLLAILGIGAYFASGQASVTALIPAFFGVPLAALGLLALGDGARKHAMHAAAALATLGLLGTAPGVIKLIGALAGDELARPTAVAVQTIMAVLSAVFVALCVRSFIQARRDASAAQAS